jgi:hypothetical protein
MRGAPMTSGLNRALEDSRDVDNNTDRKRIRFALPQIAAGTSKHAPFAFDIDLACFHAARANRA